MVLPDEYRNRFVFDCPECGSPVQSDLHYCGHLADCCFCGKSITIPDSPDKTQMFRNWLFLKIEKNNYHRCFGN